MCALEMIGLKTDMSAGADIIRYENLSAVVSNCIHSCKHGFTWPLDRAFTVIYA